MSILCYHAVDPAWRSPLAVTPHDFARQCAHLAACGRVVPLEQRLAQGPHSRSVALTFDDGFASLAEHAFPVLARHRLPAVVFLVTETLHEPVQQVDWVDTPPPWRLTTLTPEQVLEACEAGVRFASHSAAHLDLTMLGEQECERDLRTSREALEDLLHEPAPWLAYPRGRHAPHVRRAAERAGYTHALALPEAAEDVGLYAVPRVGVFPGNGVLGMRLKSSRAYLPVRHSRAFPLLRRAVVRARTAV